MSDANLTWGALSILQQPRDLRWFQAAIVTAGHLQGMICSLQPEGGKSPAKCQNAKGKINEGVRRNSWLMRVPPSYKQPRREVSANRPDVTSSIAPGVAEKPERNWRVTVGGADFTGQ